MHVHHLNCATMCPYGSHLINGTGGLLSPAKMICHCLLIESNDGLILVDTGIGLKDVADPKGRLGSFFTAVARPTLNPDETAAKQVTKLGFKLEDVRHIVPTHLDLDHAGGLPDFPNAKVHVFEPEHKAAMKPQTLKEKERYRSVQWEHKPNWVVHSLQGERWLDFDSVQVIKGVGTEVLLIPVIGHTRGHCAVAVKTEKGWLLHCGDAYFFYGEMDPEGYHCPPGLWLFQHIIQVDGQKRVDNQDRLRQLASKHSDQVKLFCAHDPVEFSSFHQNKA